MNDMWLDVIDFHQKFQLEQQGELTQETMLLRIRQMQEELAEYVTGLTAKDRAQQLDALIDLVYFALGTAYLSDFDFEEGWRRVQEANMQKIRATSPLDSKRGSTFDVIKPKGWVAPTMEGCV